MKRTALTVAFLVLLSGFVVTVWVLPEARAITRYVGGGGPGNYTTITAAIGAAVSGDTIFVYSGTYAENFTIDKTLTLTGESRDTTIIDGEGDDDVIVLWDRRWVNISGFTITNGSIGIYAALCDDCNFSNNRISVYGKGIWLLWSRRNTLVSNIMVGNGVVISGELDDWTTHSIGTSNTVNGNPIHYWKNLLGGTVPSDAGQIILVNCTNITVENQQIGNASEPLVLGFSDGNILHNNTVSDSLHGILLIDSDSNRITNNTVHANHDGIWLASSRHNIVRGNILAWNDRSGISVDDSLFNAIEENDVSNSISGVELWGDSTRNSISYNRVAFSEYAGIFDTTPDRNEIVGNSLSGNNFSGIYLTSSYARIYDNVLTGGGIYIDGWIDHWNTHSIDTSNSVNGKPVQYWKNLTGGTVPPGAGQVILANCTDVTVENQDISNATVGIHTGYSSRIIIANNTVSYNWYGIRSHGANTTLSNNTALLNFDVGILEFGSEDGILVGNNASGNGRGIQIQYSSRTTVIDNTVTLNGLDGIIVTWASDNVVERNLVAFNKGYGISLITASNTRVFHNNITCNAVQAMEGAMGPNQWDDGYPSGGNYWSDYDGTDEMSGPGQNLTGGDGIGDTPYPIQTGYEDRYPLMSPFSIETIRPATGLRADLSGQGYGNVSLSWSLSPDDDGGLMSVVAYEVYRNSTYVPGGVGYMLIATLLNGSASFTDQSAGEGDPINHFYLVCAVDVVNNTVCSPNQAAKFTRPLTAGPNLVSIPLAQSDESIEIVLQTVEYDKAWHFDSSSQEWEWFMTSKGYRRGLWNVNHTMGIWVNVTEDSNLTVAGVVPAQTTIHLHEGWNLVSFPSVNTSFTVGDLKASLPIERVEGFDPTAPQHFLRVLSDSDVLLAGRGYWVKVQADIVWNVPFE